MMAARDLPQSTLSVVATASSSPAAAEKSKISLPKLKRMHSEAASPSRGAISLKAVGRSTSDWSSSNITVKKENIDKRDDGTKLTKADDSSYQKR